MPHSSILGQMSGMVKLASSSDQNIFGVNVGGGPLNSEHHKLDMGIFLALPTINSNIYFHNSMGGPWAQRLPMKY